MHWWSLSVCLSVCPIPDSSRERKGIESWKLAGRKPMNGWSVTPLTVTGQKVKGQGHQAVNAQTENLPYSQGLLTSNLVYNYKRSTVTRITGVRGMWRHRSNVKVMTWRRKFDECLPITLQRSRSLFWQQLPTSE